MTGIETTLIQTFGLAGVAFAFLFAVFRWYTEKAWPAKLAVQQRAADAQTRIADAVERMDQRINEMREDVTDIKIDQARLFVLKQQEQPSRGRRTKEPVNAR